MEISIFEAAAAYDYEMARESIKEGSGLSYPQQYVIFDTDNYAVWFCNCSETGNVELIAEYALSDGSPFMDDVMTELAKFVPGHSEAELRGCLEEQRESINSEMLTFLVSGLDGAALTIGDVTVKCSELEYIFRTALQKLDDVLSKMEELWAKSGFDEDSVRIIMAGSPADHVLTWNHICRKLSEKRFYDIELVSSDSRFVNFTYGISAGRIAEEGEKLYNEHSRIGVDIALLAVEGGEGAVQKIPLAAKKTPMASFEDMRYMGPLFIAEGEDLELEVDQERKKIKIPDFFASEDGDLIDVRVCVKDRRPLLRIRRCSAPDCIYDVLI